LRRGGDSFVTSGASLSPWLYSAGLGLVATGAITSISASAMVCKLPVGFLQQGGAVVLKVEDLNAKAGRSLDASAI
jgi:hypothetical protein